MSLAVIIPAVLFILVAMLVVGIAKAVCLGKSTSFATEAKSADELAKLIVKEEHYEAEADGGSAFRKDKNKWTADVVTGSYTAKAVPHHGTAFLRLKSFSEENGFTESQRT